jgi:hypothetical protein
MASTGGDDPRRSIYLAVRSYKREARHGSSTKDSGAPHEPHVWGASSLILARQESVERPIVGVSDIDLFFGGGKRCF